MMNLIRLNLEQGSDEWLEFRRTRGMASEAPIVTGTNKYGSLDDLAMDKLGMPVFKGNDATAWGNEHEDEARRALEDAVGDSFDPVVLDMQPYGASLDGQTVCGSAIAEIKSPYSQERSETWRLADSGIVAPYYVDQIQQQLAVSGADLCLFAVWIPGDIRILEVKPDPSRWEVIQEGWQSFWKKLGSGELPGVEERDDEEWRIAAEGLRSASEELKAATEKEKAFKKKLESLMNKARAKGAGVSANRIVRQGSLQYAEFFNRNPDLLIQVKRGKSTTFVRFDLNTKQLS